VQERRVALRGQLTRVVASCCIARLVVLAAEDQRDPIFVHIDSPGGSIAEAMGILSTMNGIRCPVITFCRREAMGPAAIIAAHGLRGYRAAAPGCRFSLKISTSGPNGRSSVNLDSLVSLLAEVLTKDARKRQDQVLAWLKSGAEFSAQEAVAMGIIDVISSEPVLPKATGPVT
jgi:ATP-dependent Clp protease protease subunit